jgi:CRP-like cAMP-binding protein
MNDVADWHALAQTARPVTLGLTERLIVQGQEGDSLFVVAEGEVEVLLRREGGEDVVVNTVGNGAVVGEMSLLTRDRRSATVRAVEGAVVYEIGSHQYAPLLRSHPELVDVLSKLMLERLQQRRAALNTCDAERDRLAIAWRIRNAQSAACGWTPAASSPASHRLRDAMAWARRSPIRQAALTSPDDARGTPFARS